MTRDGIHDIAIIGGGIVGLATANALLDATPGVRLVLLEAERKVAQHQTGHNSGVIHSGLYYKPGSMKARFSVEGSAAMFRFCEEHDIPHERCGKIVVATRENELPRLEELHRRGEANGLKGIRWLTAEEIREHEPHAAGLRGLFVPQTGIVDYKVVAETMARLARDRGCEIRTGAAVTGFRRIDGTIVLETAAGDARCRTLVNCGGLQSDRVARLCGVDPGVRIVPFRGEYYELTPSRQSLVRNLIYPVPDPGFPFLGVHFTRMIGGGVEAGPNAVLALKREGYRKTDADLRDIVDIFSYAGFWKMAGRCWPTGMGEVWRSLSKGAFVKALQRLLPDLRPEDVAPAGSGVRAQAMDPAGNLLDDFSVVRAEGMVHVLNAPSPAATSSLRIGATIAAMVAEVRNQS
ncbi:MAG TPA: L-2-hydroxyglutarate oxidase [Terriglobia bacterium]|nr:L-2-hydroxyglutarate oxidase [Terriglobia bacterium]